ncbi:MAG: inositol monophosphatase family protein [Hyphomicrobiales bacterium]
MARTALMNVMLGAARKGARAMRRDFGEVENLQVSLKGPADFVTATDRRVEQVLHEELERARPAYGFLMEESGSHEGTDKTHRWIIDPIDGTTNFVHGIPLFAISIALERNGELVAGLIYNPVADELFAAEKGTGAFLNDRRIRVAGRHDLSTAVVSCGIPHLQRGDTEIFGRELAAVQSEVAGIRRTGSAALDLAWVAAGRFDGFWERGLSSWDVAAGMLIVREAGGMVGDMDDSKRSDALVTGNILAANPTLYALLEKQLAGARK